MHSKNSWWPWKLSSPWVVFIFGCVAIVPLLFMIVLISTSEILAQQGAPDGANVLTSIAVFCLILYVLYGALVHTLAISSGQLFARNKRIPLIDLFGGIRSRYWRVLLFDLIALVLIIPPVLFMAAGLLETYFNEALRLLLVGVSGAWILLHIFGFVWGSFLLESRGVLRSILESFALAFKHPGKTLYALFLAFLFGIASALVFSAVSGTLGSESVVVQATALLLSAGAMLTATQWYFPLNFMLVGSLPRQLIFMVLNTFIFVTAIHVLASRARLLLAKNNQSNENLTAEEQQVLAKMLEKPDAQEEEMIIDTAVNLLEKEVEQEEKALKKATRKTAKNKASRKKTTKKKAAKKSTRKKTSKKSTRKRSKKSSTRK